MSTAKKNKSPLVLRLERLKVATNKTWDGLAEDLGIKRAMIFHVLAGRRGLGQKTIERLIDCEVAAGVRTKASVLIERGIRGGDLVEALINPADDAQTQVSLEDIDKGSKKIALEYRRGSPPKNYPSTVTVTAPRNASIWVVIGEAGTRNDPTRFLSSCLPELQDKPDVLEKLTPSSYALLLDTALDLTFGLNWRSKLG